jgi:hypothetical protein
MFVEQLGEGAMNFAFTEFSEVRVAAVRRFVPLCGVPGA